MTVISRKQQNYEYPNSNNVSDTESLNLASASASDVESLHNEPLRRPNPLVSNFPRDCFSNEFLNRKRSLGKRCQRRIFNRLELETLTEEKDDLTVELIEIRQSAFARLIEDENALRLWNEFNALSEEEQAEILKPMPKRNVTETITKTESPLSRICSKIKRALKIKKPLPIDMIRQTEDEIIAYFTEHPSGLFKSCPASSFERLMVHGVAQYHNLQSISTFVDAVRYVEINGNQQQWKPTSGSFFNAIEQLRR